jgi:hypothetical protein
VCCDVVMKKPWRSGCPSCRGALRARRRGGRQSRWAPVCSSWPWALSGIGNEAAVAFRAGDLDPQIARYAFDQGQAAFANGRVALGSFAVCCGWVIASTRFLPPLGGMAGHCQRSGARTQPHQLDRLHLAAALPDVLAVGTRRGRAAHPPQRHRWPAATDRLSRTLSGHDGTLVRCRL